MRLRSSTPPYSIKRLTVDHNAWQEGRVPPKQRVDIRAWSVEVQGKRIQLICKTAKSRKAGKKKRGVITEFSRRARGRMLRKIASVDWKSAGQGNFVTLTYPDSVSDHTMEERKMHRFYINRFICRMVGRELGCFWRVEWKPRLSGKFIGQLRPHMHLLYLGCPRMCEMRIRLAWMRILGVTQYTQVDSKPLAVAEVVSVYTAKYCAKQDDPSYLDNVPYRIRTGRHAGELRRKLIPMHTLEKTAQIDQAILSFLQGEACRTLWWFDPRFDEGFTILGDQALAVIAKFHGMRLDLYGEES